ncbi:hypothetical protein K439DRAFT_1631049 [Ramaria rubella]|nr:hypothetical protein K439DRAFT_1631049 [Ramaria rubella]
MVHSALKRKRTDSESEDPLDAETCADEPLALPHPPEDAILKNYTEALLEANGFLPTDPRPVLQTLLHYLSDSELFNLIITRLSQACPRRPPLYLTPRCIEGLFDFFRPSLPAFDIVYPPLAASPLSSTDSTMPNPEVNPFFGICVTKRDQLRLEANGIQFPAMKSLADLLLSLATLLSFLEPAELRFLIEKRASESQSPHVGVSCFLEFMQSGGDGVPTGKLKLEANRVGRKEKREKKRKKKMAERLEVSNALTSVSTGSVVNVSVSSEQQPPKPGAQTTFHPDALPSTRQSLQCDMEDGEVSSRIDPNFSSSVHPPHAVEVASGSVQKGINAPLQKEFDVEDKNQPQQPGKKKKKKKGKAKASQEIQNRSQKPQIPL